jgi:hypothetical protein
VLERSELELIAAACREHDVIALTDEVYEHLVYEGEHVPLATLPGMAERTITVSSIGKTHSVTGWKIGWACGPADLIGRLRAVKQYLTFAGGTPLQHASAAALGFPDSVAAELADALRAKRGRLAAGLRAAGFDVFDSAKLTARPCARACRTSPASRQSRSRRLRPPHGRRRDRCCASRSASATRCWTTRSNGFQPGLQTGRRADRLAEPVARASSGGQLGLGLRGRRVTRAAHLP